MRCRKRKHSAYRLATTEKTFLRKRNQRWPWISSATPWRSVETFRILTIVDEHTRECLATEANTSLPGLRVIRVLEQLALTRGLPEKIHVERSGKRQMQAMRKTR